ncbi:MAG: TonB-dependent receptor, partial [Proteobacteria bacterium]|nr:TonB-dependent receptor [Pseudomonadota bacterium]
WLDSQSNLTWTRSRNRTDRPELTGKQLPRVPELELSQSTSVHVGEFRIGHSFSYTAGNYWDATNWFLAPPRALHGAFIRAGHRGLSLELSMLNLLDKQVALMDRNPLDDQDNTLVVQPINDFFGYPLPGRTWLVTLRWALPTPNQETPS